MNGPEPQPGSETERHFIELATRTLEEVPGIRDEARGELIGRLSHDRSREGKVSAEAALYHLAKIVPARWGVKGILAGGVALLVLAALAGFQLFATLPEIKLLPVAMDDNPSTQRWFDRLPADDREFFASGKEGGLYMFRGTTDLQSLETLDSLRKKNPADPGLYEAYALKHIAIHSDVPPDYRETWQRIDPGNGIWDCTESAVRTMFKRTAEDWSQALQSLDQSLSRPRFETWLPELRTRKLAVLPQLPDTYAGNAALRCLAHPLGVDQDAFSYRTNSLAALIYLRGEELVRNKDRQGLIAFIRAWKQLCIHLLAESENWAESGNGIYLVSFVEHLADSARNLDMGSEEKELRELMDSLGRLTSSSPITFRLGSSTSLKSSVETRLLDSVARHESRIYPLQHDAAGLEAGRLAEYAAAERGFTLAAALAILVTLSLAWLESFRRGKLLNGMADGLGPLLEPEDRAWILCLGAIIPFLWYVAITRLTPLGCRDIGMTCHKGIPPVAIQMMASLLLIGVLLLQSIHWRLKQRLGFLDPGAAWLSPGWIVVAVTALIIPLAGAARWLPGNEETFLNGLASSCGIPLLWLLWQGGAVLFSPKSGALGGVLLARAAAPPLAAACLILLTCQPLLKSIEQTWMEKNTVSRFDRLQGGVSLGEAKAVADLTKSIIALLEPGVARPER